MKAITVSSAWHDGRSTTIQNRNKNMFKSYTKNIPRCPRSNQPHRMIPFVQNSCCIPSISDPRTEKLNKRLPRVGYWRYRSRWDAVLISLFISTNRQFSISLHFAEADTHRKDHIAVVYGSKCPQFVLGLSNELHNRDQRSERTRIPIPTHV